MYRALLTFALATALLAAPGISLADLRFQQFDDQQLELILEQEGYKDVQIVKQGLLHFDAYDTTYALYRYADGDLQLYLGLTGVYVSYLDINEWNATRRLSRSYLDDAGDPVIEADLLLDDSQTAGSVRDFVRVFLVSAEHFKRFIVARHGG
ncbi:MAG: YbjN domain-containing protein [Pseudomonadota bacterium]